MTDTDIFAEARRVFELLPGPNTMAFAVERLAAAGVHHLHIRRWAVSVAHEYGIASYIQETAWARLMAGAKLAQEG